MWCDAVGCACVSVVVGVGGGLARCMLVVWVEDECDDESGVGAIDTILETGNKSL